MLKKVYFESDNTYFFIIDKLLGMLGGNPKLFKAIKNNNLI